MRSDGVKARVDSLSRPVEIGEELHHVLHSKKDGFGGSELAERPVKQCVRSSTYVAVKYVRLLSSSG